MKVWIDFLEVMSMTGKRWLCMALAVCLFTVSGCGSRQGQTADSGLQYTDPYAALAGDHDRRSEAIYADTLNGFYEVYQAALETENISERYALMALAEAQLLQAAVMLPLRASGGNYAVSRMAPNTTSSVLWGNDSDRYHNALVATQPITAEDRSIMRTQWAEQKGTGTWESWARQYLLDQGYTLKDSYTMSYTSDPETWDVLASSNAVDADAIVNTYDGLYEYDSENVLQPALAERYAVSDDGLTYTFYLRKGVQWVDAQGRKVAELKADDFVAGMQHMMDAQGGMEYLVQGLIVGANDYISGRVTDFSQVGVRAVDDYTVEYTLESPASYFMTMLGYSVFAPMCRAYYVAQGGKFGSAFDASAGSYTYGKGPDRIAYCGPYLVSNATSENTIVFKANPAYWNRDNIRIKTITWLFNNGQDVVKPYNDMKSGMLDGCSMTAASLEAARKEPAGNGQSWFERYGYIAGTNATTYMAFYNLNRSAFANASDGAVVSQKDQAARIRSQAAMYNVHFRRALSFALDRGAYNAQVVGEDLKYVSLRNGYTPGNFVALTEDVEVMINGQPVTFPAGTFYGQIVQAQIDADGGTMQVWDQDADDGLGSSDGFDGWYHPQAAAEELQMAITELAAEGIEISRQNPIYLDLPYAASVEYYTNRANAYKQSIETVLGGCVVINLVAGTDLRQWQNAGYFVTNGTQANYDICDIAGWGPDYGDPASYLDTLLPDYAGYMTKNIGLW